MAEFDVQAEHHNFEFQPIVGEDHRRLDLEAACASALARRSFIRSVVKGAVHHCSSRNPPPKTGQPFSSSPEASIPGSFRIHGLAYVQCRLRCNNPRIEDGQLQICQCPGNLGVWPVFRNPHNRVSIVERNNCIVTDAMGEFLPGERFQEPLVCEFGRGETANIIPVVCLSHRGEFFLIRKRLNGCLSHLPGRIGLRNVKQLRGAIQLLNGPQSFVNVRAVEAGAASNGNDQESCQPSSFDLWPNQPPPAIFDFRSEMRRLHGRLHLPLFRNYGL